LAHSTATLVVTRTFITALATTTFLGVTRTVTAFRTPRAGRSFIEAQTQTIATRRTAAILILFTRITGRGADAFTFVDHCIASQPTTAVTIAFASARSDGTFGFDFVGLEDLLLVDVSHHCSNQAGEHDNPHIVALIYRV